jgi:hypothetical protein
MLPPAHDSRGSNAAMHHKLAVSKILAQILLYFGAKIYRLPYLHQFKALILEDLYGSTKTGR